MLELIKDARDRKGSDVAKLRGPRPVVLYGTGSYAADVRRFLESEGIDVAAHCVDEQYVPEGAGRRGVPPVMSTAAALAAYPDCGVVIGFCDYVSARRKLAMLGRRERVYFIDAPNQKGFFDRDYIVSHSDEFGQTYDLLADQKSRDIFVAFINAKISGDPIGLYEHANFNQYFTFPIELSGSEVFVDCGAFDGDTVEKFVAVSRGNYEQIYAFEPDGSNYAALCQRITQNGIANVTTVNACCWSETGSVGLDSNQNVSAVLDEVEGRADVDAVRIDDVVGAVAVSYIKMDIEGSELQALRGAQDVIRREHPKLAVCAYHRPEDLVTLPQYVKELSADYKLYLRHHQYMSWEMVLYAL